MTHSSGFSRGRAPASGSAEILFFTGVRYYRMTDEDLRKAQAPKRRRAIKPKQVSEAQRLDRHG